MIGTTIDRYRVVQQIGEGEMGVVWRAEDTLLRRPVALKLLPERWAGSAEEKRRFLRGAQAAALLDHPNVVAVFGADEWKGHPYVAMALVEGETVSSLAARMRLPLDEVVRITIAAAEALGHAHSRGVIHRDIKGSNIMVDLEGRVVVLDFGLALIEGRTRLTSHTSVVGTPAYMAPEVAGGHDADPRSDLYSLGVVMFEMLTGTLPFTATRIEALFYAVMSEAPPRPGSRRSDLPEWVDRVMLRMLAKPPEERYQDADSMIAALRDACSSAQALPARAEEPVASRTVAPYATPGRRSLAVLPFRDLSDTPEVADDARALTAGLAESVSATLAKMPELAVIGPAAGGEAATDLVSAVRRAESLGARLVISGSLRRIGPRVRLSYALTDVATQVQIAGDSLDGMAGDLFELEDRLTENLLRALTIDARSAPRPRGASRDPAAHERFLQALGYLQRYDNEASVDGAIALLERLLEAGVDSAQVPSALARAYLHKFELRGERSWQLRAASACEKALALDPNAPEALLTLGQVRVSSGQYAEAIEAFERALALRPDLPEAWIALSIALEGMDRFPDAEQACRRAIAIRPQGWSGYNRLGIVFYRQGQYARSVAPWRMVTRLTPDNSRGHYNLAAALYHLDRFEEAIVRYQRSIDIQPTASAWSGLGTVHYFMGNYADAERAFEMAAALKPSDPRMWGFLASARKHLPDGRSRAREAFDRAIALVQERLRQNPNSAEDWSWLAGWLGEQGETLRAIEAMDRALSLAPHDVEIMARAGALHGSLGERAVAVRWLADALRNGYGVERLLRDPDLKALRDAPELKTLIQQRSAFAGSKQVQPTDGGRP